MPVYKKNRLIHIHIPKAGGTAIERQFDKLGDLTWGLECWIGEERRNGRWYEFQHMSMTELQVLSNAQYMDFESFAVVRNPYHRLVSDYIWRLETRKAYPKAPIPAFSSFDAFIQSIPRDINTNWLTYINAADRKAANFLIHVRPQYQYVTNYDKFNALDHILKFEYLKDEVEKIFRSRKISASNIRNHSDVDVTGFYSRRQIEMVNEIYERDFRNFSYEMI